jgi:hypothetical protein
MKHKLIMIVLAIIFGFLGFGVLIGIVNNQAQAMTLTPSWLQVGGNGLGDPLNQQIATLEVFGDYIYAGVCHTTLPANTHTTQIWRSRNGVNWEKVDERTLNGPGDMVTFNGRLYAGSWDGYVWSSADGTTWTEDITNGFDGTGQGIARFMVYGGKLYASTWNGTTGTEVWRTSNGTDWEIFIDEGLSNNPQNSAAITSEIFNGYLYMGVVNESLTGGQLWRTNGITTTAIITDGFGITQNQAISSLAMFNHILYAGTYNTQGVQVWKSQNGSDWQKINSGFNNPNTAGENGLEVFRNRLYLTVENDSQGFEVWRTLDGSNWTVIGSFGLGYSSNHSSYWDNGIVVYKEKLYISTINWQLGGQIWQLTAEPYQTYMPCMIRACLTTYLDNFSNPSSGWPISEDSIAKLGYTNGEYQILIKDPQYLVYAYKEFQEKDVQIEVDVRPASHLNGGTGVVFSRSSLGYYLFDVSENWYTLWKRDSIGGQWTMLIDWTQSPALNPGYQTNRIKIVRAGDGISMYGNNQLLATVTDGTYHGTGLGMESEAYNNTPNYDGRFDNLSVYPGCFPPQLLSIPGAQTSLNKMYSMDPGIGGPTP